MFARRQTFKQDFLFPKVKVEVGLIRSKNLHLDWWEREIHTDVTTGNVDVNRTWCSCKIPIVVTHSKNGLVRER